MVVDDSIVTLADLTPTVLDFLGATAPSGLDGRSLLPVVRGEDRTTGVAYLETMSPQLAYDWAPLFGIRTREWKLVLGARPHLFHMLDDPQELRDQAAERPEVVEALERHVVQLRDFSGPALGSVPRAVSGAERAVLGSIGYVTLEAEDPNFDASDLPDPHDYVHADADMSRARMAFSAKDYDAAIEILEDLVRELPRTFLFRQTLGSAYTLADRPQDALREFLAAADLHDEPLDLHLQIVTVADACGMPDLVRTHLNKATERQGCPPEVFLTLAERLRESEGNDRAIAVLQRLLALEPQAQWPFRTYRALSQAFLDMGDLKSASVVGRRILRRDHISEAVKDQLRASARRASDQ